MSDKLEKAVEAIVAKTEDGKIQWERKNEEVYRKNPFYRKYVSEHFITLDGISDYVAPYKEGYIYLSNQSGYREIAIQPNDNADITVLSAEPGGKLKRLEDVIKNNLDNPDDFIDSLFD